MVNRCLGTNPASRPSAASLELMLTELLQSDDNFHHVYDRAFAREALDHMREHRPSPTSMSSFVNVNTSSGAATSSGSSPQKGSPKASSGSSAANNHGKNGSFVNGNGSNTNCGHGRSSGIIKKK
jgi:hypothetical protein